MAILCNGLLAFGLFGALFVLTQFLQFQLGYSALQAGVRVLPAAAAIAVVAPLSGPLVRRFGAKLPVVAGLLISAAGLWQISGATVTTTYGGVVAGMVMLGAGAGMVMPASTGSVMGSLPSGDTGVGSATNGAFMQVGGALGVAVVGSLLSTRYQHRITEALAPFHVPHAVRETILGSLGGALAVAAHLGSLTGQLLAVLRPLGLHQRHGSRPDGVRRRGAGGSGARPPGASRQAGAPRRMSSRSRTARRAPEAGSEADARPALELAPDQLADDLLHAGVLHRGPHPELAPLAGRQRQPDHLHVRIPALGIRRSSFRGTHAAQATRSRPVVASLPERLDITTSGGAPDGRRAAAA